MKKLLVIFVVSLFGFSYAGKNGGYVQGVVTLASSIKNWDKVVLIVCTKEDEMCLKPAAVFKAKLAFITARSAPYTSPKLVGGKYTIYALNDKNDNLTHDSDTEELGGYFTEGTFDPILVEPSKLGVNIQMIGF